MKIALASDLDGTLIKNNIVPHHNKIAVDNLKSSGGMFIISTGRPYNGVYSLIQDYDLNVDYSVLLNGSLIINKEGDKILHKTIPFDTVEKIFAFVRYFKPMVSLETGFTTYTVGNVHENLPYPGKEIIDSINDVSNKDICLISLFFENYTIKDIEDICKSINTIFKDTCVAYRNVNYIDVVPVGCSKGNAVKLICQMENISLDGLYTIGDSFNDVSMFDITKNSFTFHECDENLKAFANNVVHSVSECIDDYMLNGATCD